MSTTTATVTVSRPHPATHTRPLPRPVLSIRGLSLWVEGQPVSVNSAYRMSARGRGARYLSAEARAWRDLVWLAFRMQPHAFTLEQLPLRVACTFHGVRGDADNYLKLTLDGLKAALGIDDRHFSPVTAAVVRSRRDGVGARIEVWASDGGRAA